MSTMTDPYGPNLSPPTISSSSIPDAISSENTNNEILTVGLISNSTNDPDDLCSAYLDHAINWIPTSSSIIESYSAVFLF